VSHREIAGGGCDERRSACLVRHQSFSIDRRIKLTLHTSHATALPIPPRSQERRRAAARRGPRASL